MAFKTKSVLRAEKESLTAQLEAERALRSQVSALYDRMLSDKDAVIERYVQEVNALKGKIALMETAIMPLSSVAGRVYQDKLNPPKERTIKFSLEGQSSDWQRHLRQVEGRLEKEYNEEANASKEQVTT